MTPGTTLWEVLHQRVASTPDALLFVDESGRRMTFSQFEVAAERAAAGLAGGGIGVGSVVSWILPTRIEAFVLMAALSRLEVVQNPIIPIYREREIAHILSEADVDVMIVPSAWRDVDYVGIVRSIAATRGGRPRVLALDGPLPEADPADLPPLSGPVPGGTTPPARWIFYTSGSTGKPKGARHSEVGIVSVARGMAQHLDMGPDDRNGLAFPAAHIGGPINLLSSLVSGCAHILIEAFEPRSAVATLRREGVTMAGSGTAFHLGYLSVQREQPDTPIFPRLRCCPGGGAPKPPNLHYEVKKELGGVGIVSGWGLTEAPVLTMACPTDPDEKLATTEGRPLPGVDVRVVSADGRAAAPGESGELRVRAPQMMVGYVDGVLDEEAFDEQGYLRTGDLGRVDREGYVTVTGRLKDVIIRKGENISAQEVEDLIHLHPDVADVGCIGLPDERTGERACAVIEVLPGAPAPSLSDLRAHLSSHGLRTQAMPEQIEVVDEVPRNAAGKIDKAGLKVRFDPGGRETASNGGERQ